jgi:cysteine-rich repeat protein
MLWDVRSARAGLALIFAASFAACLDWNALYGPKCGDGVVGDGETCDDGNAVGNDGCSALCAIESPSCGDGLTSTPPEECDDANTDEDDACLNDCRAARCGDGRIWVSVEDCEDGNRENGDGCSRDCNRETDRCGNGVHDAGEECDDGNEKIGDGCSAACKREPPPESCGNAVRDPDEACDDGDAANDDACLNGCSVAACGDGFIWRGAEQCDDGNSDNGDDCTRTCLTCPHADGAMSRTANGHCYTLHPEPSTFAEATEICDATGGHVWTATNAAELRDVNRSLIKSTAPTWIGFRTTPTPPSWITGEATSFQAWAAGEPSSASSGCVVQMADASLVEALWRSAACGERYPFVCETQTALVFAATHHAYVFHARALPWAEARDACAAAGGYLATVETAEEQTFLAQRFAVEVWLGATRSPGGSFEWLTGAPFDYTAFGRNQPDNANGAENCLLFNRFDAWTDVDCALGRRFLCEFE